MRNRGNLRKQRRVSRGNEIRGNPEIDQSATATDPRFRATWKLVSRRAGGEKIQGDLEIRRWQNRKVRDPRRLGKPSDGAGGFGVRGNPENESSAIPKGRDSGQLGLRPVGTAEG